MGEKGGSLDEIRALLDEKLDRLDVGVEPVS